MSTSFINADLFGQTQTEFANSLRMAPQIPDDDAIGFLEFALLYLNLEESPIRIDPDRRHEYSLKTFDGAWLFTQPLDGHEPLYLNPDKERDLRIRYLYPQGYQIKLFNLQSDIVNLQRVRSLELKEKRGMCTPNAYAIEARLAYVTDKEKWYTGTNLYEIKSAWDHPTIRESVIDQTASQHPGVPRQVIKDFLNEMVRKHPAQAGELIFPLVRPGYRPVSVDQLDPQSYWETNRWITGSVMVAFSHYYEWSIYIRETPKSVGVRIPILPENFSEVFSLRDLPTGTSRRKAICHAVRQHTRSVKVTADDTALRETLVRQHFRGETKFNWRGLELHILPSEYDIKRSKTQKKFVTV
jgi:hypothetical protein